MGISPDPNFRCVYVHFTIIKVDALRPRQIGRHFADITFKRIFVNENVRIFFQISLTFVPEGPNNNIPALVRRQAIIWINGGYITAAYMRHLASMRTNSVLLFSVAKIAGIIYWNKYFFADGNIRSGIASSLLSFCQHPIASVME